MHDKGCYHALTEAAGDAFLNAVSVAGASIKKEHMNDSNESRKLYEDKILAALSNYGCAMFDYGQAGSGPKEANRNQRDWALSVAQTVLRIFLLYDFVWLRRRRPADFEALMRICEDAVRFSEEQAETSEYTSKEAL